MNLFQGLDENMFKAFTETKAFHQKYYDDKGKLKLMFGYFPALFVNISLNKCPSVKEWDGNL